MTMHTSEENRYPSSTTSYAGGNMVTMPKDYRDLADQIVHLQHEDHGFDQLIKVCRFDAGAVVASFSDLMDHVYILIKGRINLVWHNNTVGRRLVMSTLEPGAILTQQQLSRSRSGRQFVEATEDSVCWRIPAEKLEETVVRYPILSWGLLQTHAARLVQVEDHMEAVTCKKLPERVAELLLALDHNEDGKLEGISHQMIADHLGTYRETVSSILREFKRSALIKLGYRRIELLDIDELELVAGIW